MHTRKIHPMDIFVRIVKERENEEKESMRDTLNQTGYPKISLPKIGKLRKGVLLRSDPLYWLTYRRESDGQAFIDELTKEEILKVLETGGIQLIHLEAAVDENGKWRKREVRL